MGKNKKIKIPQESRDQILRRKLQEGKEKREVEYGIQLRRINKENEYITNLVNGRYYLARCNMMADQISSENIKEKIDGCTKTEEYMRAEFALMKVQAIKSLRIAHFSKRDLFKEFDLKEEDVVAIEKDYYEGRIVRDEYNEQYKKQNKAEDEKRNSCARTHVGGISKRI